MSRFTHRQMDWRKLNIAYGSLQRKCHNPHWHGALVPMDLPKAKATAWTFISTTVWVVCGLYAASLWIA